MGERSDLHLQPPDHASTRRASSSRRVPPQRHACPPPIARPRQKRRASVRCRGRGYGFNYQTGRPHGSDELSRHHVGCKPTARRGVDGDPGWRSLDLVQRASNYRRGDPEDRDPSARRPGDTSAHRLPARGTQGQDPRIACFVSARRQRVPRRPEVEGSAGPFAMKRYSICC
jgi:hypothetical protein